MNHIESEHQRALFKWAAIQTKVHPELATLLHIPNGQMLHGNAQSRAIQGKRLRLEGVKAGVPDLLLPVARSGKHGLWIELKAEGGKPTTQQKHWIEVLNKAGYHACVCVGWAHARDTILAYLNPPETYSPGVI